MTANSLTNLAGAAKSTRRDVGFIEELAFDQVLPRGAAYCFGQEVSRVLPNGYPELFAIMGTDFGAGNGVDTFNLPDLRDMTLVGKGNMGPAGGGVDRGLVSNVGAGNPGVNATVLGAQGGKDRQTFSSFNLPAHLKPLTVDSGGGTLSTAQAVTSGGTALYAPVDPASVPIPGMPPSCIVNYIIWLGRDLVVVPPVPPPGYGVSDLEFNGPFPDWFNAVRDFGADNTGATDTLPQLQAMIDAIATGNNVIGTIGVDPNYRIYQAQIAYLPPGTVRILRLAPAQTLLGRAIRMTLIAGLMLYTASFLNSGLSVPGFALILIGLLLWVEQLISHCLAAGHIKPLHLPAWMKPSRARDEVAAQVRARH